MISIEKIKVTMTVRSGFEGDRREVVLDIPTADQFSPFIAALRDEWVTAYNKQIAAAGPIDDVPLFG